MNAVTPIVAETGPLLSDAYRSAVERANAWRGRCINLLAQGEAAVTDCLLRMAADAERGSKVKLERMVGQRLQSLSAAIGEGGPFAVEGKGAVEKLAEFRAYEPLRTMLCHGKGKVLVDGAGKWTLILTNIEIRGGKATPNLHIVRESEADADADGLSRSANRLCAALAAVLKP